MYKRHQHSVKTQKCNKFICKTVFDCFSTISCCLVEINAQSTELEHILALPAVFTSFPCPTLSCFPLVSQLSHPHLLYVVVPKVIVFIRAAVNHLCTIYPIFRLTFVSLEAALSPSLMFSHAHSQAAKPC